MVSETPTRFKVIRITEEHRRIAKILGKTEAAVVAIEAGKNSPLPDVALEVVAGLLVRLWSDQEIALLIDLQVGAVIRAIDSVHEKRDPGRPPFEKGDPKLGEAVENPVGQHPRRLHHDSERMTQGVDRIVGAELIHAQMVVAAAVDGKAAA